MAAQLVVYMDTVGRHALMQCELLSERLKDIMENEQERLGGDRDMLRATRTEKTFPLICSYNPQPGEHVLSFPSGPCEKSRVGQVPAVAASKDSRESLVDRIPASILT